MTITEEDIRKIVREELSKHNFGNNSNGKKKRKPSKWNIFLGSCSKQVEGSIGDKAKECSIIWNKAKKDGTLDKLLEDYTKS